MIDSRHFDLIKQYGPNKGVAVCLGDQFPTDYTGFTTSREMFLAMGYRDYIDIDYNGIATINHNLNLPIPENLHGIASLLYDGGTIEHVANIGQSLQTIVSLVEVGGILVCANPINCYGASYYGLDPQLMRDFYTVNGFRPLHLSLYCQTSLKARFCFALERFMPPRWLDKLKARLRKIPSVRKAFLHDDPNRFKEITVDSRYRSVPADTSLSFVAIKERNVPLTWPSQQVYPESK